MSKLNEILNTQYITLLLTNTCNYECDYCDQRNYRTKGNMSIDIIQDILNYTKKISKNKISFHLFGGEPTLNTDIVSIVKLLRDFEICMTTNLSAPLQLYKDLNITTVASYHHNYVSDYNSWFNKAIELNKLKILKHISMMVSQDNMEVIEETFFKYKDKLPMILVPLNDFADTNEFNKFKHKFKNYPEFIYYEDEIEHFIGVKESGPVFCTSGLIIDEVGDVHYCWSNYTRIIGNITNKDLKYSTCHICNNFCDDCDLEVVRSSSVIKIDPKFKDYKNQWIFCNA